jgi:AcrR family transcriptional regulator
MAKKATSTRRREHSLSRERIIEASIELLDKSGIGGLTFRALSEKLVTGPGAIYWHIASKGELVTAACDSIVARTMRTPAAGSTPQATIRALALGLFDAIDAHPWVGSALTLAPGQSPAVSLLEAIGRQLRALGVPEEKQWVSVSALLSYILGVAGQNAANAHYARSRDLDRSKFLGEASRAWLQLDPNEFPFVRSLAGKLPSHDDRLDFAAGIDLLLAGIEARRTHEE